MPPRCARWALVCALTACIIAQSSAGASVERPNGEYEAGAAAAATVEGEGRDAAATARCVGEVDADGGCWGYDEAEKEALAAAGAANASWWAEAYARGDGVRHGASRELGLLNCDRGRGRCRFISFRCCDCDAGEYSNERSDARCRTCPAGTYSGSRASTCTSCAPGKYQFHSGKSSCHNCPAGTYKSGYGLGGCATCSAGRYSGAAASGCSYCPAGRYQASQGASACNACPVGKYRSQPGATSASHCAACPAGRFSSSGAGGCSLCPAGRYQSSSGASGCVTCPAGKYQGGQGQPQCLACPPGYRCPSTGMNIPYACGGVQYYCPAESTSAQRIESGQYTTPDTPDVTHRSGFAVCPRGSRCPHDGEANFGMRFPCGDGTCQENLGQNSCHACTCASCQSCEKATCSCPLKPNWCHFPGQGGCVSDGTTRDEVFPDEGGGHGQCQVCIAGMGAWAPIPLAGVACNDGNLNTRDDTCVEGACDATPFTCPWCATGNGARCVATVGALVTVDGDEVCGCRIDGRNYAPGAEKPGSNGCKICDPNPGNPASATTWSNKAGTCSGNGDGQQCTRDDRCDPVSGLCVGTRYSPFDGFSCDLQECEEPDVPGLSGDALCDGNGRCRKHNKPSTSQCRPQRDACTPAVFCPGTSGSCPAYTTTPATVTAGTVRTIGWIGGSGSVQPNPERIALITGGFDIECGDITFRMGVYPAPSDASPATECNAAAVTAYDGWTGTASMGSRLPYVATWQANSRPGGPAALQHGQAYVVVLHAFGMTPNTDVYVCPSTFILIDTTPPDVDNAVVIDVSLSDVGIAGEDADFICYPPKAAASFSGVHDPESQLSFSVWYFGATPGSREWGATGPTSLAVPHVEISPPHDIFADGDVVYATGLFVNEAGLTSDPVTSDGAVFDCSPPQFRRESGVPDVRVTAPWAPDGAAITMLPRNDAIAFMWEAASDPHSGLARYEFGVGASCGQTTVTNGWHSVDASADRWKLLPTGLVMQDGSSYVVTMRAFNPVPGVPPAVACSDPVLVDASPPALGEALVLDLPASTPAAPGLGRSVAATEDIDFSVSSSFIGFAIEHVVDEHSGVDSIHVCLSSRRLQRGSCDVAPLLEAPRDPSLGASGETRRSGRISLAGGTLVDGATYYVSMKARNSAGVWTSFMHSDGFVYDATPPTGEVFDGSLDGLTDVDFTSDAVALPASWSVQDDDSGIQSPVLVALSVPGPPPTGWIDIVEFTPASASQAHTFTSLTLLHSTRYFVRVLATNGAGAAATISSDGVVVDLTAPVLAAGSVRDGSVFGVDLDFKATLTGIAVNFDAPEDAESGVTSIVWTVTPCTDPALLVHSESLALSATTAATTSSSMDVAVVYCSSITVTNGAGVSTRRTSDGVSTTNTAPAGGTVLDGAGPGADVDYQTNDDELSVRWDGFFDSTGIVHYTVSLGTVDDPTLLVDNENVGTANSFTRSGLGPLSTNVLYVATVTAYNGALVPGVATSDGVRIVTEVPTGGSVAVVSPTSGLEIQWQPSVVAIAAVWSGFENSGVPLASFLVSVVNAGGNAVSAPADVGTALDTTVTGLSLQQGAQYRVVVRARGQTGASADVFSSPVAVDSSPPVVNSVTATLVAARWVRIAVDSADDLSGLGTTMVALGSTFNGTQIVQYSRVHFAGSDFVGVVVPDGTPLYPSVVVFNGAGLHTHVANPVATAVVDETPPRPPAGGVSGSIEQAPGSGHVFTATWGAFVDTHSGVSAYVVSYGHSAGAADVAGPIQLDATATSHSVAIPGTTVDGTTLFATVAAVNGGGTPSAPVSSAAVVFDLSPPLAAAVLDGVGPGSDVDFTGAETWSVAARWPAGCSDPHSRIVRYEWAAGTAAGATDVQAWSDVGLARATPAVTPELGSGVTVFVGVRCTNAAGLSTTSWSDGQMADNEPPTAGAPRFLRNDVDDADACSAEAVGSMAIGTLASPVLRVAVCGVADDDSGIHAVFVGIGPTRGATTASTTWESTAGESPSADVFDVTYSALLFNGETLYATVVIEDRARLRTTLVSDAVVVDATPPDTTDAVVSDFLTPQPGAERFLPHSPRLECSWSGLQDPESGLLPVQIAFGTSCGADDVVARQAADAVGGESGSFAVQLLGSLLDLPGFDPASGRIVCSVWVSNRAGSPETRLCSPGSIAELQPPAGDAALVVDNLDAAQSAAGVDVDFQASLLSVGVGWGAFSAASGISSYEVAVSRQRNADDGEVVPFQTVGGGASPRHSVVAIPAVQLAGDSSATLYAAVRATSNAGAQTVVWTDGIRLDASRPTAGSVSDGVGDDDAEFFAGPELSVTWTRFSDPDSDIASYEVGVGTSASSVDVQPLTRVGGGDRGGATLSDLTLTAGQRYFVTVVGVSGAGLRAWAVSDGAVYDPTPPSTPRVVVDGNAAQQPEALLASIDAVAAGDGRHLACSFPVSKDAQSGVLRYDVAFGSGSVDDDIAPFTSLHGSLNVTSASGFAVVGGLAVAHTRTLPAPLPDGSRVVCTVRVTNGAGVTVTARSSGVIVDTSAPIIAAGAVQASRPMVATAAGDILADTASACWPMNDAEGVHEPHSAVQYVELGVATSAGVIAAGSGGEADVVPFRNVGLSSCGFVDLDGISSASTDTPLFFGIRATNAAGLTSLVRWSPAVTADADVPSAVAVIDVSAEDEAAAVVQRRDAVYTSSTDSLGAQWSWDQPETAATAWGIGTTAGGFQTRELQPVSHETSPAFADANGLDLVHGQTYYVTAIVVAPSSGIASVGISSGIRVDRTPPQPSSAALGAVVVTNADDLSTRVAAVSDASSIGLRWRAFEDGESGVVQYRVRVLREDELPSRGPAVLVQGPGDAAPEGLDVDAFELLGGGSVGVDGWLNASVTVPQDTLTLISPGTRFVAVVAAINGAGLASFAWSASVVVDDTAPQALRVVDLGDWLASFTITSHSAFPTHAAEAARQLGLRAGEVEPSTLGATLAAADAGDAPENVTAALLERMSLVPQPPALLVPDADCQNGSTSLGATWSFEDAESRIVKYEWGISTSASGGDDVRAFESVGTRRMAWSLGEALPSGLPLYVTVLATNEASLTGAAVSDGIVVRDGAFAGTMCTAPIEDAGSAATA